MAERCKRCSIEHRHIRKELSKWQKNVALLCGMERVAQELMGGRKWRKLMIPLNCEQNEAEDWSPNETCYLCNSKTQSSCDSIDSVVPPCDQLLDDKTSNDKNSGDKCSFCAGLSTLDSKCSCKSSLHSKHPNDQPLDLSTHSRHKRSANTDSHSKNASHLAEDHNSLLKVPQVLTKTKAIKRNRLPTNTTWKRTYTEEELEAALRDIQSGKLGTRRAAVIYGIPRSTLRNKVYKLALDRNNGKRKVSPSSATSNTTTTTSAIASNKKFSKSSLLNHNKSNTKTANNTNSTLNHMLDDPNNSQTSASESLKQILKNAITQRAHTNSSGSPVKDKAQSSESVLNNAMAGQALMAGLPGVGFNSSTDLYNYEALATIQMLSTIECGQALAPLFTQFLLNIHQLALTKRQSEDNCEDMTNSTSTPNIPILPDLIRKLAEDQIQQTTTRTNSSQSSDQSNGDKSESQTELTGNSNVILKVPSYKPKTSSAVTSSDLQSNEEQPNVTTSDTEAANQLCTSSSHRQSDEPIDDEFESKSFSLKDIIAKSISQRLYNSTSSAKFSNVANSEDSSSDALTFDDKYDGPLSSSDHKNSGNVSDHSNPSTPEKRNRPKRGRYRNYNRDDLAKAVRAVQRGEMSVHRAGTLFGVPHSTLEYKVKERHLLRPKKRVNETSVTTKKESINKSNGNTSNRVVNGSTTSVSTNNSAITGGNSHLPFWHSAFPFFPVDVNNTVTNSTNFFASNMMRKLQENARMNEEVKTSNDSTNEFGGLLLESLIKSSLVNNTLNSKSKLEDMDENNASDVVNTSLQLLKEVSALEKKD